MSLLFLIGHALLQSRLQDHTIGAALFTEAPDEELEGLHRGSQIDRETKLLKISGCSAVW